MGDCILSTPAIHLLKQYRPDLEIAVVADSALAEIYGGNPDVSKVLPPRVGEVRGFGARLCLNLHGGTRSARLTLLSGAAKRAGYDMLRNQWIYNVPIPTAQQIFGDARPVHTAEHMASAMFYLGVPLSDVPGSMLFAPAGRAETAPAGGYAVIHPMASHPEKTWPAARFLELAEALKKQHDLETVFIGSASDDLAAFDGWPVVRGAPLTELMRLIRDADLFVGNDSGPAHIAAAFGTPEVVLFGPSNAHTWAPWKAAGEVIQARDSIESIGVGRVLEAVAGVRRAAQ